MIHHATDQFDFSGLHLGSPTALAGGSFYTKLSTHQPALPKVLAKAI